MANEDLILECSNGFTLEARNNCIYVITRKQEEAIPVSAISSVTLKKPGLLHGSIGFKVSQPPVGGVRLGLGITAAIGADRNYFFRKADYETAMKFRDFILDNQNK